MTISTWMASGRRLSKARKQTNTGASQKHKTVLNGRTRCAGVPVPRGFRLKTSMTGGQQYSSEVWAIAAAWREQLEAGSGRLPRGRAAQGLPGGLGREGVKV